ESDLDTVAFEVFNVGDTTENYQKATIVSLIREQLPDAKVTYVPRDEDPRDYRVDFSKIARVLEFKVTRTVPDGILEVRRAVTDGVFPDPYGDKHGNTRSTTKPTRD